MYAPNTPAPAWLTRAKAILLRLESEDLEQAARANLATEKSNLENEIQALDAEIEQARQRGANASQRALQAATNYRVAKKVYLTLTAGAIIQTAVGVA